MTLWKDPANMNKTNKWIDIKDQLPGLYHDVLVFMYIPNGCSYIEVAYRYESQLAEVAWTASYPPTHWMHLPDHPIPKSKLYCCDVLEKLKFIMKPDMLIWKAKDYLEDLIKDCEEHCDKHKGES